MGLKDARDLDRWRIQERCANKAMDRNLLVVLPTGSGKTLIAIKAIEMTLELERESTRRIIFLAPHHTLAVQQCSAIEENLELDRFIVRSQNDFHHTIGICESRLQAARDDQPDFAHVFESCQVLVCTPVKLLRALESGWISMGQIALLVLDEAHHFIGSEPYAVLMQYFYRGLLAERRPRVLALTASPVERPPKVEDQTIDGARHALAKIEADLDVTIDGEAAAAWLAQFGKHAEIGTHMRYTRTEPSARTQRLLDEIHKATPALSAEEREQYSRPEAHQYDEIVQKWHSFEEAVREADAEIGAWAADKLVRITLIELEEKSADGRFVRHRDAFDVFDGVFDDDDEENGRAADVAGAAAGAVVGVAAPSQPQTERLEQLRKRLRKKCREGLEQGLKSLGGLVVTKEKTGVITDEELTTQHAINDSQFTDAPMQGLEPGLGVGCAPGTSSAAGGAAAEEVLVSDKVRVLAGYLAKEQPRSTLVFVEKRLTARLLAETLLEYHAMLGKLGEAGTRGEPVAWVVGEAGARASGASTSATEQLERLERFKRGAVHSIVHSMQCTLPRTVPCTMQCTLPCSFAC